MLTRSKETLLVLLAGLVVVTPLVGGHGTTRAEQEAKNAYPDLALQVPIVNTAPGLEYASSTRAYQGIPGIERTAKGRLWAVWSGGGAGVGPFNYVVLVTSGDDGRSWSEPKLVIDPPGNVSAWTACLWLDPLGHLWLFWTQSYGAWDGRDGVWAIVSENPDSASPQWSQPKRLADGMVQNKPTALRSGAWLLPVEVPFLGCRVSLVNDQYKLGLTPSVLEVLCHDLGNRKGSNVYSSVDQGQTWAWLGQARVEGTDFDEHMIVERRDGSLWMLVRTRYGIGQSVSTDLGKTWGPSGPSGIGHPVTRFFIRRLKSGGLLMVRHNAPSTAIRSHLTAYLSDDDGRSWSGGLLLDERTGVSYPDGVEAEDGTIRVIYDRGRDSDREVLMAMFTEADITQGRCIAGPCQLKMLVNRAGG